AAATLRDDGADVAVPGGHPVGVGTAAADDDGADDRGRPHAEEHSLICRAKSRYLGRLESDDLRSYPRPAMTLDRRQFLKSSLSGAAACACWVKVPTLAHAKGRADLIRMTERPPNYESVRSTFTTRITPVERFYLRNHFDLPKI